MVTGSHISGLLSILRVWEPFEAGSLREKRRLPEVSKWSLRDFIGTVFAGVIDKQARRGDSRG